MSKLTVIAIDDSKPVLMFMEQIIVELRESFNIEYHAFNGAQEALEALNDIKPDVVLCDMIMPAMDGLEAIRHIKKQQPNVRCVLVTSRSEGTDFKSGKEAGADNYLTKPVSVSQLRSIFRIVQLRKDIAAK